MFEGLRSFVAELLGSDGDRPFGENDYRMAATAMLVHVADADGAFDPLERERLQAILMEQYGLESGDAGRLIAQAQLSEAEDVDLDRFAAILRRKLDADGRLKLVEMMWDLVYADGAPLEVEDSIVSRIGHMLGVPEADLDLLRRARAPGPGAAGSGTAQ
ncbi:MAG: TerB family tellurite resistance protein [Beijerinckiaceae bacterium]|nr:TerB family tellurite resistance protein [Beijerinckiaceae bacterium]